MASALLDTSSLDPAYAAEVSESPAANRSESTAEELRREVAERLAAHRSRRNGAPSQSTLAPAHPQQNSSSRSSRIAAAVAERYAKSPSYHEILAAEAERATQQARAEAEVAARNAAAVALAEQELLESIQRESARQQKAVEESARRAAQLETQSQPAQERTLWPEPVVEPTDVSRAFTPPKPAAHRSAAKSAPALKSQPPKLTVHLYEDDSTVAHVDLTAPRPAFNPSRATAKAQEHSLDEERALDEEIAFRQSPVFEEPVGPAMPLPANLIEFPRQLVAARKARPRYAEGPLRSEAVPAPGQTQLRIFEVDPAQISTTPAVADVPTPQWTSLWLDAAVSAPIDLDEESQLTTASSQLLSPGSEAEFSASSQTVSLIDAASIPRRLKATALDCAILLTALGAFAATSLFVACELLLPPSATPRSLSEIASLLGSQTGIQLRPALAVCALVFAGFYLLYQTLFFTFSESTPGMRAARIALCTFDDENPTRRSMRRRLLALLVSIVPFALGLLWATLDEDRLAWHDRITRTYQRTY